MSTSVMRVVRLVSTWMVFLLVAATSTGCGMFALSTTKPAVSQMEPIESGSEDVPFTLKILEEVNDGKELHVLGTVSAKAPWEAKNVVLRLAGLTEGSFTDVKYFPLSKLMSAESPGLATATIQAGQTVNFGLAVPSAGLTDYQLELLWGEEALAYLRETNPKRKLAVTIMDIRVETLRENCGFPVCDLRYRFLGSLLNTGQGVISEVVLGVGILELGGKSANIDLSSNIPDNEQRVEIKGLRLFPGESKPFRLLVDRAIAENVSDGYRPVLRVVSFEGE